MKKFIALLLTLVCVFGLVGCNTKSMNYIIENKLSVTGIVQEVHDDYIIVYSETADGYPNGSNWSISLKVENKDSYTDVVVGDEIVFYYDGMAMETDPLQVSTVYAITLKTPADRTVNEIEQSNKQILSLNDVIILSQNGYKLTWSDFEQYKYVETGSGLYIRFYEINDLFSLWIGGSNPDSEPRYIYLALTDDMDTRIDIRDGGVAEFISEHNSNTNDT